MLFPFSNFSKRPPPPGEYDDEVSIDYVKEFCVKGATPKTVLDQVTAERNARLGGGAGAAAGGGGALPDKNAQLDDEILALDLDVAVMTRKRLSAVIKEYQWNPNNGEKVSGKRWGLGSVSAGGIGRGMFLGSRSSSQ